MTLHETWLHATLSERNEMAKKYNITKKGQTHVVDNVLKEDGYDPKEVAQRLTEAESPIVAKSETIEVKKVIKKAKKK